MDSTLTYCTECGQLVEGSSGTCLNCTSQKEKSLTFLSRGFFRRYGLILGLVPWFALLLYLGYAKSPYFKTAAIVNDRRITLTEVEREAARMASLMEAQGSKPSDDTREQLRARGLQLLINQSLLETEADRRGIDVSDEDVRTEIGRFRQESGFPNEDTYNDFVKRYYGTPSELQKTIRMNLLYGRLLSGSGIAAAGTPADRDRQARAWFEQLRQSASVRVLMNLPPSAGMAKSGGCCSSGSQGGCSTAGGGCSTAKGGTPQKNQEQARALALGLAKKESDSGSALDAKVIDYGCHLQVDVFEGSRLVRSYSYQNGEIRPL